MTIPSSIRGQALLFVLLVGLALATLATITHAQNSNDPTQQGMQAFNQGRYDSALEYFQQARSNGESPLSLQYNIAVTLYRLARYDEALDAFSALEDREDWRVLVNYNYGLVHDAMGDADRARMYYQLSLRQQENADISALAQRKLAVLNQTGRAGSGTSPGSTQDDWLAFVTLRAGHDSNATSISDDLVQDTSAAEDSFSEALVYGQMYLNGQPNNGLKLYGLSFSRLFSSFDNLDTLLYGGGLGYEFPLGDNQAESGLRITQTRLSGDKVSDELQLSQELRRTLSFGTVSGEYQYSLFNAGSSFQQVDGNRHRVELGWNKRVAKPVILRVRYRHDINERDDLQRGGAFSSYSPTRDSIIVTMNWQVNPKFVVTMEHEYIDSSYDGINHLRDSDGQIRTQQRENERNATSLNLDYQLNEHWRVNGKAARTEADDNFLIYTYDKTQVMAGLNYVF